MIIIINYLQANNKIKKMHKPIISIFFKILIKNFINQKYNLFGIF